VQIRIAESFCLSLSTIEGGERQWTTPESHRPQPRRPTKAALRADPVTSVPSSRRTNLSLNAIPADSNVCKRSAIFQTAQIESGRANGKGCFNRIYDRCPVRIDLNGHRDICFLLIIRFIARAPHCESHNVASTEAYVTFWSAEVHNNVWAFACRSREITDYGP
jgi:hypothetical protein